MVSVTVSNVMKKIYASCVFFMFLSIGIGSKAPRDSKESRECCCEQSHPQRKSSTKKDELTDDDIQTVRNIWGKLNKEPAKNGVLILQRFLEKYDYYDEFNIPKGSVVGNPLFETFASKVMGHVNDAVNLLDDPTKLKHELHKLGKKLAKKGRKKIHYVKLRAVLMDVLDEKYHLTKSQKESLNKAFDTALPFLFEGLEDKDSSRTKNNIFRPKSFSARKKSGLPINNGYQ